MPTAATVHSEAEDSANDPPLAHARGWRQDERGSWGVRPREAVAVLQSHPLSSPPALRDSLKATRRARPTSAEFVGHILCLGNLKGEGYG